MIGLFIVFTTYMVKEGIREHFRDLEGAMENAENSFILGDRNEAVLHEAKEMKVDLEVVGAMVENEGEKGDEKEDVNEVEREVESDASLQLLQDGCEISRFDVFNLRHLTEHLPDAKDADAILQGFSKETDSIEEASNRYEMDDGVMRKRGEDPTKVLYDLQVREMHLTAGLHNFTNRVISFAEEERARNGRYYVLANWLSYALYTIGWMVALVANLWGGEETKSFDV
ncbi:MAG: hypothetical protein ACLQMT_09920 [Candidatus Acidiferrales bacterium]